MIREIDRGINVARRLRPVIEQRYERPEDLLGRIPFHAGRPPVVYYSAMEDDEWQYLLYAFYHTEDWSDTGGLIGEWDSHHHDFEGALFARNKTKRVRHIVTVAHYNFVVDTTYGDDWVVVIESQGHAVRPFGKHRPWAGNTMTYCQYELIRLQDLIECGAWPNIKALFNKNHVLLPDQWNDKLIEQEFGVETAGDIFSNPGRLLDNLRKQKRIL